MFKTARLSLITLLLVTVIPNVSRAEIVLNYTGQLFTEFVPNPGSVFDSTDRITGTVTFDAVGDATAKSFSMSTTIGGNPGFTFVVPNAAVPPTGITVDPNTFTWGSSLPVTWDLVVFGNLDGSPGDEQIAISDAFGDQAVVDLSQSNASAGATGFGVKGEWTVVPEPGSLALATIGLGLGLLGLWHRRRTASQPQ